MKTPLAKLNSRNLLTVFTSFLFITALLTVSVPAQKRNRLSADTPTTGAVTETAPPSLAPAPIFFPQGGNFNCKHVVDSADPRLDHVVSGWEWKFDPPTGGGPFPMTSGLGGGLQPNPNLFMTYNVNPGSTMNSWQLSWTSASALTTLVAAVIIKGGNGGTNVYPYPFLSAGDTGPFVLPTGQAISHISFCLEPFTAPSAAPGTVSGRVLTSGGTGISNARVMVQNVGTGQVFYSTTNMFGRYGFKGLAVGDFYVMSVSHRRYVFGEVRAFTLESDLTDYDFVSGN